MFSVQSYSIPTATILLVEDDHALLDGISDLLEIADLGYELRVMTASNGAAGLRAIAGGTPDLIISDIMMPRMNGFEFLEQVRENPAWVHIPLIFLTAKGAKQDIRQGRRSGAELYVTKPFNIHELLDLVKTQLDRTFIRRGARDQDLDNLKRNLLQLLNHEFRTPLTYVTAYYEMLSGGVQISEDTRYLKEYLRGIQVGRLRLTRLVDDLIAVMELRTGEKKADFERRAGPISDLAQLVEETALAWSPEAAQKGLILHCSVTGPLPMVFGVRESLEDVLNRLVHNAIKFVHIKRLLGASDEGEIILSASSEETAVRLAVHDNGIGFPPQVHEKIFELFYQHNRDRLEQQGSGVGLTIVKGAVELHRGRLEIRSKEDAGSTFSVILPPYRGVRPAVPAATSRKQATLLVVEDDKYLLDGLRELLELYDGPYELRVLTAINGLKGLKVLENHQPDLIISDIMMPKMDGYQFLAKVRQNATWVHIPFIFLTAKGERRDVHQGRRSGAEEYIIKPYDSYELLDLIESQLNRHFQVQHFVGEGFADFKRSILELLRPEFRLALSSVSHYSDALASNLEASETEEELTDSLRGMQFSSHHLTRLVENLITLAELKTGEAASAFQYRAHPLAEFGALLRQAGDQMLDVTLAAGARIGYTIAPELPLVVADRESLLNGLIRALEISLKLCPTAEGTALHLTVAATEGEVELQMQSGGTIAASDLSLIQTALSQNDAAILDLPEIGADLAIVKGVIELHQGRLQLESSAQGGCILTLFLPAYRPA